jgi:hypothetical protein
LKGAACFDPSGQYRYWLSRCWLESGPQLAIVMLNPSRADAERNDPTLRRCLALALGWGFGSLTVVNLFAYCSADPQQLWQVQDPVGPDNDGHLLAACDRAARVLLAWGNWGCRLNRDLAVLTLLAASQPKWCCLGRNRTGRPRHPLYVRRDCLLQGWTEPASADGQVR